MIFERLAGSPEGDFLGAFLLGTDGVDTQIELPIQQLGFTGSWSPDGRMLVVTSFAHETGLTVGTFEVATQTYAQLRHDGATGDLECTDWNPDATSVICALGSKDPAKEGIYTVDVASGIARQITHSPYHHVGGTAGECGGGEGRAVYSADGSRFAYEQQKCGVGADPSADEQGAIVVANADGSNPKVIVPFGGVRTHPGGELSWSPTADLIAFGTQDGVLSVIGADGTNLRTIALPGSPFVYGPTWSPDGQWLLVTLGETGGSDDLYVVAADGSQQLRLTETSAVEAYTDWGPTAP